MLNQARRFTVAFCLVALLAGITLPLSAGADESFINSSATEAHAATSPIMVDLLILRPIGLVSLVFSSVLFLVPVLPITLLTRPTEIAKPFEIMVTDPARYIWGHRLGTH